MAPTAVLAAGVAATTAALVLERSPLAGCVAVAREAPPLRANPVLAGTWVKDMRLSDPMDEPCDTMRLSGVMRLAIRLMRGIEIKLTQPTSMPAAATGAAGEAVGEEAPMEDPGSFEMALFSVLPWFRVRETYRLDGTAAGFKRRDLRSGKQTGSLTILPSGNLHLKVSWDGPFPGRGTDDYVLTEPHQLVVTTVLEVDDGMRTTTFRTVYRRK